MTNELTLYNIYVIKNKINNKLYFGQTINSLQHRFKEHCKKSNNCKKIRNAIQKYGKENFWIELVATTYNETLVNYLELFYIKTYNSTNNGYNILEEELSGNAKYVRNILENKLKNRTAGHIGKRKNKWRVNISWKSKRYSCECCKSENDAKILLNNIIDDLLNNIDPSIRIKKEKILNRGGVYFDKKKNRWRVGINWNKINYHIDFCKSEREANKILKDKCWWCI